MSQYLAPDEEEEEGKTMEEKYKDEVNRKIQMLEASAKGNK